MTIARLSLALDIEDFDVASSPINEGPVKERTFVDRGHRDRKDPAATASRLKQSAD